MSYIAITADYHNLRKVRRALRQKGYDAYLPAIVQKHARSVEKDGKTVMVYRRKIKPLIRYVLAKAPEHPAARDLWLHDIRATKYVTGYVTILEVPAFIPDDDVFGVWCQVADMHKEIERAKKKKLRWFRAGEKARLQDGAFAGRVGTVQWISKKGVELELMLFGAKRVVTVEKDKLEAAA